MHSQFHDRRHAGALLASTLSAYAGRPDVVVLALPRGGVPVGYEVARRLSAPLDILVVRKLGVPGYEELAMGAIGSGDVLVLDERVLQWMRVSQADLDQVILRERAELARREQALRGDRPPLDVRGKTVIVVDDGLATGSTMRAAVKALRKRGPARIVVAVPIAAPSACSELAGDVDEIVCAVTPEPFRAVGLWYQDFRPTSEDEVRTLLALAAQTQEQQGLPVVPQASSGRAAGAAKLR